MTKDFFQSFILLILVTDPFGNVPIFVSALSHVSPERRWRVVVRECAIAFALLLLFMFFGKHFLTAMQLSDVSLRIGGGVILFLIALRMVFPQEGGIFGDVEDDHEPFIVPLAIPALAGPSALATVLLFSSDSKMDVAVHLAALTAVAIVWLIVLLSAEQMQRVLGKRVMTAFERLMGLILTAMSVEMLLAGIRDYLKTLS
ncbi:MarC family protein [Undibacterium sp. RTI2.1]|uniref:MarC family protein n=1 Tax=unclassified Undibacterium TaxID=2630295 RepID=UPI002AB3B0E5|nr:MULTISPECIES: MarC family protein [unclassified Undibacterium]MDY7538071.1 MarC family protein [Undibacterium sp. 5I1]MEB0032952.1 MarC family protein [Undibacterium sp. RTI2.1]MEB0118834.1 MarC family protein [Undibacterium sp. RTI2.2]MEB0233033.1 MarC family protein [Undibacterium sp. 10I3]MEB0259789.1 MarC family protein [Undibacterium sp. 5I1]